ncbi:hypothetical protein, partial [Pseudomonas sp.]|uniref:hypothetical protein n=1 Tax=Pseudomonas sp. TaxID=306 RepID=UPI0032671AD3
AVRLVSRLPSHNLKPSWETSDQQPLQKTDKDQNVGAGLLPMTVGQISQLCLTYRHREQAPSHIF